MDWEFAFAFYLFILFKSSVDDFKSVLKFQINFRLKIWTINYNIKYIFIELIS